MAKVLIVDDTPDLLDALVRASNKEGLETMGKLTFAEAKAHLNDVSELDFLVTDYTLDEGNGLYLVQAFQEKFPQKMAAIISGHSKDHVLSLGPEINQEWIEYFEKPFSTRVLRAWLREKLGSA